MADRLFRYPYDIQSALSPWREELGQDFDTVVARLADRDRAIEDYLEDRLARHAARAVDAVATTLVNGAFTKITLGNLDYDDTGAFRTASSDYLVPRDGLYAVDASVQVDPSGAAQDFILGLFVDGTIAVAGRGGRVRAANADALEVWGLGYSDQLELAKGAVVDIRVFVNVANAATEQGFSRLAIHRVGPLPDA